MADPKFDAYIEPLAVTMLKQGLTADGAFHLSIAISLKRLADHLTPTLHHSGLVDAIYDVGRPNQ